MKEKNHKQDIEIVKIQGEIVRTNAEVRALRNLLKDFIGNHFLHLRQKVDWILYLIITTLISIAVKLLFF